MTELLQTRTTFSMNLRIASSRWQLGQLAAEDIASELRRRLARQQEVRMILAAAPSQNEMLNELIRQPGIDWRRVTAFHMDEYLGLPEDSPQLFHQWLRRTILDHLPFKAVHLIQPGVHPERTCREYAALLQYSPLDLCLLGIGTNGHLAFNDPPADFGDPQAVKIVTLDAVCRQQQVDDECFASFDDVPTQAITLSIPALLSAERLFCCVPGELKATAVRAMVHGPVSGLVPATALRLHPSCTVYLDPDSASLLKQDREG
jgi:glucosamine-6-phosphate deaminase